MSYILILELEKKHWHWYSSSLDLIKLKINFYDIRMVESTIVIKLIVFRKASSFPSASAWTGFLAFSFSDPPF